MLDRDKDKKQLNNDDLAQVRSLIGKAPAGDFSVDDILAEYGRGRAGETPQPSPDLPWPEAPRRPRPEGKVVAFPGRPPAREVPEAEQVPDPAPEVRSPGSSDDTSPEERSAPVIPFPQEESALTSLIRDIGQKADDYADHMFQEDEATDHEEVRRLERLIPGTDREDLEEAPPPPRRPKRQQPPPPDTDPRELAKRYGRGLKGLRIRALLVFFLGLLSLFQVLAPLSGLSWPPPADSPALHCWISVGLLALGVLLSADVLIIGLIRAFRLRVEMEVLAFLACAFTLADGISLALAGGTAGRLPYAPVCLAGLFFLLHGTYHKRCALRLSCRTASASASPYRVTLDEGKWSGRDTYAKWSGTSQGFGSQIQTDDGAQRIFHRACPLLLAASVGAALLSSFGAGCPERLLWALSALFSVTAAFGSSLAYGRSFHKVARRLSQSGAALAGWPGMAQSRSGDRVLVTDTDLFPPGYVELNGYKVMPGFPAERVVAYTATLIRDSGSGLGKLFHDQLRTMGGLMRSAQSLEPHEGGGLSANIRGDQVLVGSAAFMNLMDVSLPQGLNVKNAVFCAIDGQLAGIFALNYTLPDTVFPALEELILEKVGPVLATRDLNLIPAMLHQRFKLAADKMDFPQVERRWELSDPDQTHGEVLTALLCREGLLPFAESITAAKRLRRAARLGAAVCCAGSWLGLLLAGYLTFVGAYTSLSPLNLLIYMLTWLAPVWLLSGWVHRF